MLLLIVLTFSAEAAEPDWSAIRKNQAWYYAADDSVVAGKLNTIVSDWLKGEGKEDPSAKLTVYLCQDKTLEIKKIRRGDVSRLKFKVDKTALPKAKKKTAQISEYKPGSSQSGLIAGDENTKITVYVWLEDPAVTDTMDSPDDSAETLGLPGSGSDSDSTVLTNPENGGGSTPFVPSHGGGGYGGGTRTQHAKEKHQSEIGYDQVGIWNLVSDEKTSMSTLVLSGETQPLSLTRNGEPADFVPVLIGWQDPEEVPADHFVAVNTLLLQAADTADKASCQWVFSGELLRKLLRSGITYLALETENQAILLPTEGFLSGTLYDELKMRGTAGSLFSFEISMDENRTFRLSVTVGDQTTVLTEDPLAAMHWTNIRFLSVSELNVPEVREQENG